MRDIAVRETSTISLLHPHPNGEHRGRQRQHARPTDRTPLWAE